MNPARSTPVPVNQNLAGLPTIEATPSILGPRPFFRKDPMTAVILFTSSLLVVVLVLILIREHRLRRALECLLRRLLKNWRNNDPNPSRKPVDLPDRRMQ